MKNSQDELVSLFYDKDLEEQRIRNGIMKEIERKVLAKGKTLGMVEGALNKQKEMIMKMYNKGYDISDIVDVSGITIDEVKNIVGIK